MRPEYYEQLLGSEKAELVITDAPYNVPVNGFVTGGGRHREFVMGSGEMTPEEFADFLRNAFANLIRFSSEGSIHFLFMDWRHLREMLAAVSQYGELKNLICWNKQSAGRGSFYRTQHELIFVMKKGKAKHQIKAISRERRNLYDAIGEAFSKRTGELANPKTPSPTPPVKKRPATKQRTSAKPVSTADAAELVNA